ncbi:11299_t:CDS:2, partial [Paraglomus occultum]
MSSPSASPPSSPASTSSTLTEERSTRTMADVIKNYKTEELIDYLRRQDLDLKESHFKIFRQEEISGRAFLNTTKEEFRSYGLKGGTVTVLVDFIEEITNQKLRSYSSYKTLDDLKEMLRKNKVNGEDITNIKQFTPVFEEIDDNNKAFNHCMDDIILKLSN